MIIPAGEMGQIVKEGKIVERQYQPFDTDKTDYCWKHSIELTSDWKNPNEEDKKKLEKIRLIPAETTEKDGKVDKFRICKKCWNKVEYTKPI